MISRWYRTDGQYPNEYRLPEMVAYVLPRRYFFPLEEVKFRGEYTGRLLLGEPMDQWVGSYTGVKQARSFVADVARVAARAVIYESRQKATREGIPDDSMYVVRSPMVWMAREALRRMNEISG